MNQDLSLFRNEIARIGTGFTAGEWVTIYERDATQEKSSLIFPCLVDSKKMRDYRTNTKWEMVPGKEGRASFEQTEKNGKSKIKYQSFAQKGIEPFVYLRSFVHDEGYDAYTDISEEFVLYFNLLEIAENKEDRQYFFIDALGRKDEVIQVKAESVRVKLKYLLEYISVRKKHLVLCFDCMQIVEREEEHTETGFDISGERFIYHYMTRPVFTDKVQHRITGKTWIAPTRKKSHVRSFDRGPQKFETFITGRDAKGQDVLQDCKTGENKYLVLTWFNKKVLDKYLRNPTQYKVSTYAVVSNAFSLKMDNSRPDYVGVYLIELGVLPYKEQQHWKKYNVWPF